MLARLPFGPWLPDLAPAPGNVARAENVYPVTNGYRPVRAFLPITPALPERFTGGGAWVSSTGETSLLAGTANKLLRYENLDWDVKLTALTVERWGFAQYGDLVIGVNGGAPIKFDLIAGTASNLGGSPPDASLVAQVRDFVVLAGDPADIITVTWSGFNDAEQWTSGTNQSDSQQMLSGGEVMGLAGGEYGTVLQRDRVVRMTYVGGEVVFQFDEIASNVGCMAKGSSVQAGQLVFFLSERGFMVSTGTGVTPIGNERVDRTFFARYSREDITNTIRAAVDPRNTLVVWSMPGTPGALWCYNWALERWSIIETSVAGVFSGFTTSTSLEALSALYPGGLETIPYSLDDPRFTGGNPLLLLADATSVVGSLSGETMPALVETVDTEPMAGRTGRYWAARALSDDVTGAIRLDLRRRAGDVEAITTSNPIRANGDVPLRCSGRYVRAAHQTQAGAVWSYTQGVELQGQPGGSR
jgi:hypothetical protein